MSTTMLYKLGGDFAYEGEFYTYCIVNDEDIEQSLSDGWSLTTTEAIAKAKKPVDQVLEAAPAEHEQESAKKRGRHPKAE